VHRVVRTALPTVRGVVTKGWKLKAKPGVGGVPQEETTSSKKLGNTTKHTTRFQMGKKLCNQDYWTELDQADLFTWKD